MPERKRVLVVAEARDVDANDLGRIADLMRFIAAETSVGPKGERPGRLRRSVLPGLEEPADELPDVLWQEVDNHGDDESVERELRDNGGDREGAG